MADSRSPARGFAAGGVGGRFASTLSQLPRNERRATLAELVGQRAGERRQLVSKSARSRPPTPTPPPIEVGASSHAADDGDAQTEPQSTRAVALSGRGGRQPTGRKQLAVLMTAVIGLIVVLGMRPMIERARSDDSSGLLGLVRRAQLAVDTRRASVEALVFGDDAEPGADAVETAPDDVVDVRREGHVSVPGGILVFPSTFQPTTEGTYDLIVHFHGNTAVVKESAEVAKLDAVVAIINLGIGSAPYEEYYNVTGAYEALLEDVNQGVKSRGVKNASLGRVALCAWSAGYGALSSVLSNRKGRERLDAILVFDGIHAGWESDGSLKRLQMRPFARVAERAARGEIYFGLTHSQIDPIAYGSSTASADYLVAHVGAERIKLDRGLDAPVYLDLESMKGAVSKRREKKMEPTAEAKRGTLHIIGYRGETKEHHMAHLFQMGATLLPELALRWSVGR